MTYHKNNIIILFLISLVVFVVFGKSIGYGLILYDDPTYLSKNPNILYGPTLENIIWAFYIYINSNWAPITLISYQIDGLLYGDWYGGYHLSNLLFHITNSLLLFIILNKITKNYFISISSALIFSIHPLHVESVVWLSQRKDLLSTLFLFLSFNQYINYCEKNKRELYIFSLLFFSLGLLSKVNIVVFPFLLLFYDYYINPRNKSHFNIILEKAPYFAVALIVGLVNLISQELSGALKDTEKFPFTDRLTNSLIGLIRYIEKTLVPTDLSVFYPFPEPLPYYLLILALITIVLVTVYALFLRKISSIPLYGWVWFILFFLPISGLLQTGSHSMADRYSYLTNIGIVLFIVWLVEYYIHNKFRYAFLTIIVSILSFLSFTQTNVWKNSFTLFSHAISINNNIDITHKGLADYYRLNNQTNIALTEYKLAVKLNPKSVLNHTHYSKALALAGKDKEALSVLEHSFNAIELVNHWLIYRELASYYFRKKELVAADKNIKKALSLFSLDSGTYYIQGLIYEKSNHIKLAISSYEKAIKLNRFNFDAYKRSGVLHFIAGNKQLSHELLTTALKIKPGDEHVLKLLRKTGE